MLVASVKRLATAAASLREDILDAVHFLRRPCRALGFGVPVLATPLPLLTVFRLL
jgi:hypothetical protein